MVVSKAYSKRFCRERVSHHLDANVDCALIRSRRFYKWPNVSHTSLTCGPPPFATFFKPLFTFLSSPTSSAVRDYRSVFFERLQNIHVRSAQGFLRSLEWHIDCIWPFLGAAICDWEFPVWTPEERIGWLRRKKKFEWCFWRDNDEKGAFKQSVSLMFSRCCSREKRDSLKHSLVVFVVFFKVNASSYRDLKKRKSLFFESIPFFMKNLNPKTI